MVFNSPLIGPAISWRGCHWGGVGPQIAIYNLRFFRLGQTGEVSRWIAFEEDMWRIILGGWDTDTWLITMVIVSPLSRVVGPLLNGLHGL